MRLHILLLMVITLTGAVMTQKGVGNGRKQKSIMKRRPDINGGQGLGGLSKAERLLKKSEKKAQQKQRKEAKTKKDSSDSPKSEQLDSEFRLFSVESEVRQTGRGKGKGRGKAKRGRGSNRSEKAGVDTELVELSGLPGRQRELANGRRKKLQKLRENGSLDDDIMTNVRALSEGGNGQGLGSILRQQRLLRNRSMSADEEVKSEA